MERVHVAYRDDRPCPCFSNLRSAVGAPGGLALRLGASHLSTLAVEACQPAASQVQCSLWQLQQQLLAWAEIVADHLWAPN